MTTKHVLIHSVSVQPRRALVQYTRERKKKKTRAETNPSLSYMLGGAREIIFILFASFFLYRRILAIFTNRIMRMKLEKLSRNSCLNMQLFRHTLTLFFSSLFPLSLSLSFPPSHLFFRKISDFITDFLTLLHVTEIKFDSKSKE